MLFAVIGTTKTGNLASLVSILVID